MKKGLVILSLMLMPVMAYAQETGGSESGGAMMGETGGAMMGETGGAMMDNSMMEDGTYDVELSGSQEVPPVTTDASGAATFTLAGDSLSLTGDFSGLSSPYVASHVHLAAMGENGDVIFPLNVTLADDKLSGAFSAEATLTPEQVDAAMAGNLYVNVHSEMNPSGEIRAQLVPESMSMGMMGETGGAMMGESGGAMMGETGGAMMGETGGAMMDNNMMSMTFADVDTDGNGEISEAEFDAAMGMGMMGGESGGAMMGETGGAMMGKTFADYDTDGNGSISEAEFSAMMAPQ